MNTSIDIVPRYAAVQLLAAAAQRCVAWFALVVLLAVPPRSHAALADCALEESHQGYGCIYDAESWSGGGEALVLVGSGSMPQIYDMSTPATPVLLGEVNVSEAIWYIAIASDGQLAAVSSRFGGITLVDISDRASPALRSYHPVIGRQRGGLAFDDDLLHVAMTPARLRVLDVSARRGRTRR